MDGEVEADDGADDVHMQLRACGCGECSESAILACAFVAARVGVRVGGGGGRDGLGEGVQGLGDLGVGDRV